MFGIENHSLFWLSALVIGTINTFGVGAIFVFLVKRVRKQKHSHDFVTRTEFEAMRENHQREKLGFSLELKTIMSELLRLHGKGPQ